MDAAVIQRLPSEIRDEGPCDLFLRVDGFKVRWFAGKRVLVYLNAYFRGNVEELTYCVFDDLGRLGRRLLPTSQLAIAPPTAPTALTRRLL